MAYRIADQLERQAAARPSGWTAGRIVSLVASIVLVLVALVLLGAGGAGIWADQTQREAGYATTGVHHFSTSGSALTTEETHLGSAGVGWLYAPGLLGKVRIRVTPTSPGRALFVGIARAADVDRYLAGVNHAVVTDFFGNKQKTVGGGPPPSPAGSQRFWAASADGSGPQTVVWKPSNGSWTVVVMNADGRPRLAVEADLGAKLPDLLWIALGLLIAGAVLLSGGVLLIVRAVRYNREGRNDADRQPSRV